MKFLLDENLPHRLVSAFDAEFPSSTHVSEVGLSSSTDEELWLYASEHGFTIVSKDSDFHQMSFLRGFPPKVVWVRKGNCSVREIEALLLSSTDLLREFISSEDASVLLIS